MGLAQDFWTYEYKGKRYFGIVEVCGDYQYRSLASKTETHIDKALSYVQGRKILSHMSVQSFLGFEASRNAKGSEETYYPFFLEFEPSQRPNTAGFNREYEAAAGEAFEYIAQLMYNYNVDQDDILISITAARSIYVFINPKVYGLKPHKALNEQYKAMHEAMAREMDLTFQYLDASVFAVNKLIKVPGSYYENGYVVPITLNELNLLSMDADYRHQLTAAQRPVDRSMPGRGSMKMMKLFQEIRKGKTSLQSNNQNALKDSPIKKTGRPCIDVFEEILVPPGERNFALVSVAIAMKNDGSSPEEVENKLSMLADRWQHDENEKLIRAKVRAVFRSDYQFSCEYVRTNVSCAASACQKCTRTKACEQRKTSFSVSKTAIEALKNANASLRHYQAYMIVMAKNLSGHPFNPEEHKLSVRTLREMCKMVGASRIREDGLECIKFEPVGSIYLFPNAFIDRDMFLLGEKLKLFLWLYTSYVYKAKGQYGMTRISLDRIMATNGYQNRSSAKRFVDELVALGYGVYRAGYLFALYTMSYKVIEIEEKRTEKVQKEQQNKCQAIELKAVGSDQKHGNGDGFLDLIWKLGRGSP